MVVEYWFRLYNKCVNRALNPMVFIFTQHTLSNIIKNLLNILAQGLTQHCANILKTNAD